MKKFMTNFEQIKLFAPFLQTLSIVVDATSLNDNDKDLIFAYKELDINKQPIAFRFFSLSMRFFRTSYEDGIHRICINPFGAPLHTNTRYLQYTLENANNPANIIASIDAEICNVPQNSLQLVWLNNLAGHDFWNFERYEITNKVEKSETFSYYNARNKRIYDKQAALKIKVFDKVKREYIKGLQGLANARQVWIDDVYNTFFEYRSLRQRDFIEIVPDPNTLKIYEYVDGLYLFELEFTLTKLNV